MVSRSREVWRKAQETILATESRRKQRAGQRTAQRLLRGLRFVPAPPFRVVKFEGGAINYEPGQRDGWQTDWHVADARGRTVKVIPHREFGLGDSPKIRLKRAERFAELLNRL